MSYRDLANAIRKGHTMIGETSRVFLVNGCGCALGAAYVGVGQKESDRFGGVPFRDKLHEVIAKECGVTEAVLLTVSHMHHDQLMPRLKIADWLDTLESQPTPQRESDTAYYVRQMAEIQRVTVDA